MTQFTGTPSVAPSVAGVDTLTELEFGKAVDLVAHRAVSPLGADAVRSRRPSTSAEWIQQELATVEELASLLGDGDGFEPEVVPDISDALRTLNTPGGVLDPGSLVALSIVFEAIRRLHAALEAVAESAPRVAALAVDPPSSALQRAFSRAVEPDGTIKDEASAELRRARQRVRDLRQSLVDLLQRMARQIGASPEGKVTVRGGRYVIPVRRDARSRVQGIVHDESSSGATLFVEPGGAVDSGNELRAAEAEEARTLHAVLRTLTERARTESDHIAAGWEMCVAADELYARARYMIDVGASIPEIRTGEPVLSISRGFHPLILEEAPEPVPFDLTLASDQRTLLISGPNAGGKTVLLKAVSLISVLAQSGIVPPVGVGTSLPIFQRVFADIGDHQSIAESLSTFSAHIAALSSILQQADERSLVLLDEVGAGTDPFEGAALAGAVLLALTARRAVTVATTHLSQLKDLAAAEDGFLNASLEFDGETLTPTYRLLLGQPGRSYGLAIAERLGFPANVLGTANELMPESARSLEAGLAELEEAAAAAREREESVAAAEARLAAAQARVEREREALAKREERIRASELQLEREGREQARRFLLEARRRVEEALGVARAAVSEATAKEARRLVEDGVREEAEALKKLEGKGWRLKQGAESKLSVPAAPTAETRSTRAAAVPETASSEVDLRGLTAAEAEAALLPAIDQAVVADLPWLRIIHGKGTGVLRASVARLLKRDRRITRFRLAPPAQGGAGVTIAEFGS